MLSIAKQACQLIDPVLNGLEILLDPQCTKQVLTDAGIDGDSEITIQYVRYKPQRRCVTVVKAQSGSSENLYVFRAFSAEEFRAQQSKIADRFPGCDAWYDANHNIRIDRFPFDPELKHVQKCHCTDSRKRLISKVLQLAADQAEFQLQTLAYKPSRRYVCSVAIDVAQPTSEVPSNLVLKFYAKNQYQPTLRRLMALHHSDFPSPALLNSHAHYRAVALKWITGQLLQERLHSGVVDKQLLYEVGMQLSRLHNSVIPGNMGKSQPTHDLRELADYISLICPSLSRLVVHVTDQTLARLASSKPSLGVIHGDFYAKQVLIQENHIRFIDFDQVGVGDRYQDLGNFVAKLYWDTLRLGNSSRADAEPMVRAYSQAFLAGAMAEKNQFDARAYGGQLAAALIRCATHPFRRARRQWQADTEWLLRMALSELNSC